MLFLDRIHSSIPCHSSDVTHITHPISITLSFNILNQMKWLILVVYQSPLRSLWLILSPCPWLLLDASSMWMIRIVLLPLGREGEPIFHFLFESDSRFDFYFFKSVPYTVSGCSPLSPTFPTPFTTLPSSPLPLSVYTSPIAGSLSKVTEFREECGPVS